MEYIPLGDLEHNVAKLSGRLPEAEGQIIAGQILEGLEIMHAEGFAHRDLKPQVQYLPFHVYCISTY
jgi:serine/threonine protein kinase